MAEQLVNAPPRILVFDEALLHEVVQLVGPLVRYARHWQLQDGVEERTEVFRIFWIVVLVEGWVERSELEGEAAKGPHINLLLIHFAFSYLW